MTFRTIVKEAGYFALFAALLVSAVLYRAWMNGFFDPSLGYSPGTMRAIVWVNPWGLLVLMAGWCGVRGLFVWARRFDHSPAGVARGDR